MKKPSIREYGQGDRNYVRAQQIWLIVASLMRLRARGRDEKPHKKKLVTYGRVAEYMGLDPRAGHTLGNPLGMIAAYCILQGLPCLNTVVVVAETMKPGDGVLWGSRSLRDEQQAVFDRDWFLIGVPTTKALREAAEIYFNQRGAAA